MQAAAVAVAILEWLDHGDADLHNYVPGIEHHGPLQDIYSERGRQDRLWGPQAHPLFVWLAILGKGVGAVAEAAVALYDGGSE